MLSEKTLAAISLAETYQMWLDADDASPATHAALVDAFENFQNAKGDYGVDRTPMPAQRKSEIAKFRMGGQVLYVTSGFYEDGTIGEVFLDIQKQGSTFRGLMGCFATAVSVGLQYGIPLKVFTDRFVHTKFGAEAGPVSVLHGEGENVTEVLCEEIPAATSLVDLAFRELALSNGIDLPEPPPKL